MNWKELNELYPLSFLEWVNQKGKTKINCVNLEWVRDVDEASHFIDWDQKPRKVGNNEVWPLLLHFDSLSISVNTETYWTRSEFVFGVKIIQIAKDTWYYNHLFGWSSMSSHITHHFRDRKLAIEQGLKKAFEIRNDQLKAKKDGS